MAFAAATICTLAFYLLVSSYLSPNSVTTSTSSTEISTTPSPYGALLRGSTIYSQLGYPLVSYNGNSQYSPSKPNFTLSYRSTHLGLDDVGFAVATPVMSLTQAVRLVESPEGPSKANYSLVAAEFDPGIIVNNTVWQSATWLLWFAQVYDGFWLFGQGNDASSFLFSVNAASGTVSQPTSFPTYQPLPGNYALTVTGSQAMKVVRGLGIFSSVPFELTQGGNLTSISPRIIRFDSGSSLDIQHPLNSALDGTSRLCWMISLTYSASASRQGWEGEFAVDAQSGELDSVSVGPIFPESFFATVNSNLVQSSARNLTISQETFQMSVNATGLPSSIAIAVPGVLVVRPGSTASIEVNFTSNSNYIANLTLSNPLSGLQGLSANGLPQGVSARFSNTTLALQGGTSTTRTIMLTIEADAPAGTYLMYVDNLPFFLTVWNGAGQWPPPPSVG